MHCPPVRGEGDRGRTARYKLEDMRFPPSFALIALLTVLAAAGPAAAGYDDGVAAFRGGDYRAAHQIWTDCAEAEPRCQYGIGYLYHFGLGMPVDTAQAKSWYEKAAARNDADALYALGLLYENANLGPRDLATALRYYREAASHGPHGDAEYAIGRMILRGRGVARDPGEAIEWLKKAAGHGHPAGQYMLGAAYEAGWGVKPDGAEALYWYSLAARNDQVELMDHDMSFQPAIAIDALKKHLSPETVKAVEARLAKTP